MKVSWSWIKIINSANGEHTLCLSKTIMTVRENQKNIIAIRR